LAWNALSRNVPPESEAGMLSGQLFELTATNWSNLRQADEICPLGPAGQFIKLYKNFYTATVVLMGCLFPNGVAPEKRLRGIGR